MNAKLMLISLTLSAGLLAGCDRGQPAASQPPQQGSNTPPVTMSQPPATAQEQKAASPPIQGQVDPKEPAQRRDFENPKR